MPSIRCFIAVNIPDEIKKSVSAMTAELRSSGADVKWPAIENLHITLKFLGNTDDSAIPKIKGALDDLAKRHESFNAGLKGAGAFPNIKHPRVVWIGVMDGEKLSALAGDVESSMAVLGYAPETRGFSPHLTIGRTRSMRGIAALQKEINAIKDAAFGEFRVDRIALMKSELSPSGAKYTKLHKIGLCN